MRFYKYLYYRLYSWNLRKWSKNDMPQYNALFGVSFMINVNLIMVPLVMEKLLIIDSLDFIPKLYLVITYLIIITVNYFFLVHNQKYQKIVAEFEGELASKKRRNTFLLWVYVAVSFGIPLVIIDL